MLVLNFLSKLLDAIVTFIEIILSVRFVLIMFGVKSSSEFVVWIYKTTAPLVFPFKNIFQQLKFLGLIIDLSTLLAIIAFGLAGIILTKLVSHPTKYN